MNSSPDWLGRISGIPKRMTILAKHLGLMTALHITHRDHDLHVSSFLPSTLHLFQDRMAGAW